jgi:hypothetical protein
VNQRCVRWILVLFAALCVCGASLAAPRAEHAALSTSEWQAIQKVIGAQLEALRKGNGARAFGFATAALQLQFQDAETFMRMVKTVYEPLLSARYTEFLEGAVIEGAVIQPLRLVLPDETVLVALYQMEKQNGRWRIAGCVITPSTVRST